MPDRNDIDFLIVGAGRGGTSLLMGLLDEHEMVEVGFELHAIDCLMGFDLSETAYQHRANLIDYRVSEFKKRCIEEAMSSPDKLWGNKITTEQIYGLHDHNVVNGSDVDEVTRFFQDYFAETKIIFIMRDGRTCVRSKLERTTQDLGHAISRWKYSVEMFRKLQRVHSQLLVVKYEDLVRDTTATLVSICDFLGIDYQEAMLKGVTNKKIPSQYQNSKIDKSKLSLKGVPPLAIPLLLDDLRSLNYISDMEYWIRRIRHNRWFGVSAILVALMVAVIALWL